MDSTNSLLVDLPVKNDMLDGQMLGKAGVQQQSVSGISQTFLPGSEQVSSLAEFLEDQTDEGYATSPAASSPGSIWSAVPSPSTVEEDTISSIASLFDEMSSDSTVFRPSLKRTAEDLAVGGTAPKCQKVTDSSSLSLVEGPLHGKAPHCDFTSALKHSQLLLHLAGTPAEEADPLISRQSKCQSSIESSKTTACRKATRPKARRALGLSATCPSSHGDIELVISDQPERHHRARYIIEGSRGCVKNEAKVGYPAVQLKGWNRPVELQVFIVTDQGKIRPHGYYQACKVTGQHATPCSEEEVDCTKVINIPWQPSDNGVMELRIDCVGILKLRNADVEHNGGLYRSKKKSTSVRMAFRVTLPEINVTLQTISSLICCTQPLGHPEIIKKSLTECSAAGGQELYIIGKNFISKNCEVNLLELSGAGKTVWSGACEVDKSLFHKTHIVCTIPPYQVTDIKRPVEVFLVVTSGGGKSSELMAHPITYTPVPEPKAEVAPVQEEPVPDLSNAAVLQLLASRLTCTKDSSPPILSINDQIPLVSMGQPLDVKSADLVNQQKQALQQQIIQQTQQQSFEDLMKVAAGLMTKATPVVQPQQQEQLPLEPVNLVPQAIDTTGSTTLASLSSPSAAVQGLQSSSLEQNALSDFVSSPPTLPEVIPPGLVLQTNAVSMAAPLTTESIVFSPASAATITTGVLPPSQLTAANMLEVAFPNSQLEVNLNPNSQPAAVVNDASRINLQVLPGGQLTGVAVEDVLDLLKIVQQKPTTLFP